MPPQYIEISKQILLLTVKRNETVKNYRDRKKKERVFFETLLSVSILKKWLFPIAGNESNSLVTCELPLSLSLLVQGYYLGGMLRAARA